MFPREFLLFFVILDFCFIWDRLLEVFGLGFGVDSFLKHRRTICGSYLSMIINPVIAGEVPRWALSCCDTLKFIILLSTFVTLVSFTLVRPTSVTSKSDRGMHPIPPTCTVYRGKTYKCQKKMLQIFFKQWRYFSTLVPFTKVSPTSLLWPFVLFWRNDEKTQRKQAKM